ncbi:MAG: hypothetical protein LBH98_05345 [Chitinispirillales bacterium]|jgi:hypothetical protein|nr:hypothetical protein [Chitinispirillales bacterium]
MDFNKNREALLKQFSQKKQASIIERRNLEARNRIKEKEKEKTAVSTDQADETVQSVQQTVSTPDTAVAPTATDDAKTKTQKPPLALFGSRGLFITTLKSILQQYCEVYEFYEIDEATEFLFENKTPISVMDIDSPNDPTHCQDFFTTGKTVNPNMHCIVYQKDEKLSEEAEFLKKQGATIMQKPVNGTELIDLIKKFTAE